MPRQARLVLLRTLLFSVRSFAMISFRREYRIRKQADFDRVYRARLFAADDVLIVNGSANRLRHARLGLSVSKKVGTAVVRNRWKRLIREAFRQLRDGLPPGIDLVVRPQKGALPEFERIQQSLPKLAWRIARRLEKAGKTSVAATDSSDPPPP